MCFFCLANFGIQKRFSEGLQLAMPPDTICLAAPALGGLVGLAASGAVRCSVVIRTY